MTARPKLSVVPDTRDPNDPERRLDDLLKEPLEFEDDESEAEALEND